MPPSWTGPLGRWYRLHRESLPWRDHPTPYRVWVGEVMSQQTRLAVAVPRFLQFVDRLPDVQALASCPEGVLRGLWSGLGYYARARNLVRGARHVVHHLGGELPRNREGWIEIPGCGPYTSAMVASICHGEAVPAVDGNVVRVWSRLTATHEDVRFGPGARDMHRDLESRIRRVRSPGDFNQALMELGQKICTPRSPSCQACPVRGSCRALSEDVVHLCPVPRTRRPPRDVQLMVTIPVDPTGDRILVGRRDGSPFLDGTVGFGLRTGSSPGAAPGGATFCHTITHHRILATVAQVTSPTDGRATRALASRLGLEDPAWIPLRGAGGRLATALDRKALDRIKDG